MVRISPYPLPPSSSSSSPHPHSVSPRSASAQLSHPFRPRLFPSVPCALSSFGRTERQERRGAASVAPSRGNTAGERRVRKGALKAAGQGTAVVSKVGWYAEQLGLEDSEDSRIAAAQKDSHSPLLDPPLLDPPCTALNSCPTHIRRSRTRWGRKWRFKCARLGDLRESSVRENSFCPPRLSDTRARGKRGEESRCEAQILCDVS